MRLRRRRSAGQASVLFRSLSSTPMQVARPRGYARSGEVGPLVLERRASAFRSPDGGRASIFERAPVAGGREPSRRRQLRHIDSEGCVVTGRGATAPTRALAIGRLAFRVETAAGATARAAMSRRNPLRTEELLLLLRSACDRT